MNPLLVAMGVWLLVDGVASIINYRHQSWWENSIRGIRIIISVVLIVISI
jgi:hypothetical protein